MKLKINNYEVGFWDTFFIFIVSIQIVMALATLDWPVVCFESLLLYQALRIAVAESVAYHLKKKVEQIETLSGDVQKPE